MGLSSWDCVACGHSILHTSDHPHEWQEDATVSFGGPWVFGNYDGYGRLDGEDVLTYDAIYTDGPKGCVDAVQTGFPRVMHMLCWRAAGKPEPGEVPASVRSEDQGHANFHDIPRPKPGDFADRKKWSRPPGTPNPVDE